MVSFPIWDTESFIKVINKLDKKEYGSIFRFGSIGGYMCLLKDMSLETFEEIFPENPFCKEHITLFFRKEISLKYGEHAEKSKIKPLSKRELKIGFTYKDFSGHDWIYLGQVEKIIDKTAYRSKWEQVTPQTLKGHGFLSAWDLRYLYEIADRLDVLISVKRLMSQVGDEQVLGIPASKEFIYRSGESKNSNYRGNERIVTVKFL